MGHYVQGAEVLTRRMKAMPQAVLAALNPALARSAQEIAADARSLAETSRSTGALIASIDATAPGETTPAYASDGGRRTAEDGQAFVTTGELGARHRHLVEFGTDARQHQDGTGTMAADLPLVHSCQSLLDCRSQNQKCDDGNERREDHCENDPANRRASTMGSH